MKNFCIIPARGGSKRIPRKNIKLLNDVPLIAYTIRAALKSNQFDEIFVSTENKEIREIAISEGVNVDNRPIHMSGDKITKVEVIKEFLQRHDNISNKDTITALLPTCPFRTHYHIQEAFELFKQNSTIPFLIGVTEYDFPIQLALKKEDDNCMTMAFKDGFNTTRSQNIEKRYHPNGAMYIANVKAFIEKGTFFNSKVLTYQMDAIASFDIDYPYQFEIAQILAKKIRNKEIILQ